jgi:predicted RNA binding protein YcfA (HicA-like mRNA interferase family)
MKGYGKEVRDKLERAGWELFYREGDHDVWRNLRTSQKVTVPVNLKSQDIANDILKDAGLPKAVYRLPRHTSRNGSGDIRT